jgi:hypothetical protein
MNRFYIFGLLCLSSWLLPMASTAQSLTVSPYSRYALGDIFQAASTRNASMGGIGAATANYASINLANPAGYADLRFTTMDISAFGQFTRVGTEVGNSDQFTAGFQNIAFGFASQKGPTLVFGFAPFSTVGYELRNTGLLEIDTTTYIQEAVYAGEGGLNQAFIGAGHRFWKDRLRLGANFQFRFGNSRYNTLNRLLVNDTLAASGFQPISSVEDTYVRTLMGQLGVIYEDTLNREKNVLVRLGGVADLSLTSSGDRFRRYSNGLQSDSLGSLETQGVTFPPRFTGGVTFLRPGYWSIGLDVVYQDWSQIQYFGDSLDLQPELRVALGSEWTPDPLGFSYFKRINYRAGFYYQRTYIAFDGEAVPDYGVTLGVGLPASRKGNNRFNQGRASSRINFSVELGRRGSSTLPLEELYARFRLGLTLNDTWFIKRVVD